MTTSKDIDRLVDSHTLPGLMLALERLYEAQEIGKYHVLKTRYGHIIYVEIDCRDGKWTTYRSAFHCSKFYHQEDINVQIQRRH